MCGVFNLEMADVYVGTSRREVNEFIEHKLRYCSNLVASRSTSFDVLHYHLDWLHTFVENAQASGIQIHPRVVELIREATTEVGFEDLPPREGYCDFSVLPDRRGVVGRPRLCISPEDLEWFVSCGYTAVSIAECLGVHPNTVRERLNEYNLGRRHSYSRITDDELDHLIEEILVQSPNTGYRMMSGYLLSRGHRVQQQRIREGMIRADPEGVIRRTLNLSVISRRQYSVPGPQALWHVDGNHKLIMLPISVAVRKNHLGMLYVHILIIY